MIRINLLEPKRIPNAGLSRRISRRIGAAVERVENWMFPNPQALLGWRPAIAGPSFATNIFFLESTSTPGGKLTDDLEISKAKLSDILQKKGHGDVSILDKAFVCLNGLPAPHQEHNLKVAFKLSELEASPATVAASLLLDFKSLPLKLDPSLKTVLENRDKLNSFDCKFDRKGQTDYFRTLLYRVAESQEVLLLLAVKDLIDLQFFGENQRAERAFHATSWILKYLGFEEEGGQLEDLAFLHLDPHKYHHTEELQKKTTGLDHTDALEKLKKMAQTLSTILENNHLPHQIKYRVKRVASTARKLEEKGKALDVYGIRIILLSDAARDCYAALEKIKTHLENEIEKEAWEEVKSEFSDYIAAPKDNGYQSLHCHFMDLEDYILALQIRTREMDRVAEFGRASHASYKTSDDTARMDVDGVLSIPKQRFQAKKESLQQAGVHFFYDESSTLHKVVTGDPRQSLTFLDAAFAMGINTGLYVVGGSIDRKKAALKDQIASGQTICIQIGSQPQIHGRSRIVNTFLARAILQATSRGQINPRQPLDETKLVTKGKSIFKEFLLNFKKDFQEKFKNYFAVATPDLKFSMKRLVRRKGFSSENEFYLTLALLEGGDRDAFLGKVKNRIRENAVLVASYLQEQIANLEVLVHDIPGVSLELLRLFEKYEIRIVSLEEEPIRGSIYGISKYKISIASQEKFNRFLEDLENLYKEVPPPTPQVGKTIKLKLRIRHSANKLEIVESILREILKLGANIREASLPEAQPKQEIEYDLQIQLPLGGKGRKITEALDKRLSQISGIGFIRLIT